MHKLLCWWWLCAKVMLVFVYRKDTSATSENVLIYYCSIRRTFAAYSLLVVQLGWPGSGQATLDNQLLAPITEEADQKVWNG